MSERSEILDAVRNIPQMSGREVFEQQTQWLNNMPCLKNWVSTEYLFPNGDIQRWWVGNGESLVLTYRDYRRKR